MLIKKSRYPSVFFALFLISLTLNSCDTNPVRPDEEVLGFTYFPLKSGFFIEYQVEESIYATQLPVSRLNYELREETGEAFKDLNNEEAFSLRRLIRNLPTQNWQLDSVWLTKRTQFQAIRQENNFNYIKLSFPVSEGLKWNGNALNNLEDQEYFIKDLGKAFKINNIDFEKTLTVIQSSDSSLIANNKSLEIYANGIGLVYKEMNNVKYRQDAVNIGKGIIESGKVIKYRFKRNGTL